MVCPLCNGRRLFFFQGQLIPCPECEGQGEIHCCDGLQEQSDESSRSVDVEQAEPNAPAKDA